MKYRAVILSALLALAGVALTAWIVLVHATPRATGPLAHEAYVWQRAWTRPVRDAVTLHATNFAALAVLRAEVSWQNKKPKVTPVAVDYRALVKTGHPVGLALRIGAYPGPFADHDAVAVFLADLAASLIAEAHANQLNPCELQIDFDCAASKLDGYCVWLAAIQRRVAPVPVTITALPSWLRAPAFAQLARHSTNYVLQVHSLERPRDFNSPFTLCDPQAAQRAVERAARLGVPFRVALPTYGYLLAFDRAGQFLTLSAEGPEHAWPEGTQLREVNADPRDMAALVQSWTLSRPAAMRGVIWYRLPVAVDNLNWRWPTLAAIIAARSPRESFRAEPRRVETGLTEIDLINDGELDISSRLAVEVRWSRESGARFVAGDGLRDFELVDAGPAGVRFQSKSKPGRLAAGDKQTIGWLRFNRDCEVQVELKRM